MIAFTSNIADVRADLNRLEEGFDEAAQRAFEPMAWLPIAKSEARTALLAIAERGERESIAPFVEAVTTAAFPQGMNWELAAMRELLSEAILERFQNPGAMSNINPFDTGTRDRVTADLVEEWVRTEKRRDERDVTPGGVPRTDDEIASRLMAILFTKTPNANRLIAAKSLLPHLLVFAEEKQEREVFGLSFERATEWLAAVLEAWTARILEEMPGRIVQQVEGLWK